MSGLPGSPRRLTGRIGNHQVSVGNLISRRRRRHHSGAHHHRVARPDLLLFRHERGRLSRLSARHRRRHAERGAGHRAAGLCASERRDGMAVERPAQLSRQSGGPQRRDDPRSRHLCKSGYFLTPGQFGRIRIPASQRHVAILVPDSAVVTDQSRKLVMTVRRTAPSSRRSCARGR